MDLPGIVVVAPEQYIDETAPGHQRESGVRRHNSLVISL